MTPPGAPIEWESFAVSGLPGSPGYVNKVPKEVMDSIARNKVCLKGACAAACRLASGLRPNRGCTPRPPGGIFTAVGGGLSSLNLQIRKARAVAAVARARGARSSRRLQR